MWAFGASVGDFDYFGPGEHEQQSRSPQRSRLGSRAKSGAPAKPSKPEQLLRAPSQAVWARAVSEQTRPANSSTPTEPHGLERLFRMPMRFRSGFKRTSQWQLDQKGLERRIRAPQWGRASFSGQFRAPARSRSVLERPISSASARPSGLKQPIPAPQRDERARSQKHQLRCSRAARRTS